MHGSASSDWNQRLGNPRTRGLTVLSSGDLADFLKIELSILPILLGLALFNLKSAYAILILRTVLKLLLNNKGVNDYIGLPMNLVALGVFVLVFALLWKKNPSRKNRSSPQRFWTPVGDADFRHRQDFSHPRSGGDFFTTASRFARMSNFCERCIVSFKKRRNA
jgi:hypothetical protein